MNKKLQIEEIFENKRMFQMSSSKYNFLDLDIFRNNWMYIVQLHCACKIQIKDVICLVWEENLIQIFAKSFTYVSPFCMTHNLRRHFGNTRILDKEIRQTLNSNLRVCEVGKTSLQILILNMTNFSTIFN